MSTYICTHDTIEVTVRKLVLAMADRSPGIVSYAIRKTNRLTRHETLRKIFNDRIRLARRMARAI